MKARLPYTEVYITNVCNHSCTHCQTLNNFAFNGHQLWGDYRAEYQSLSDKLDIDTVQIMGGEPTLNPDFDLWVEGISNLWPGAKLQIATNGARLDKINNKIYDILSRNRGTLWITCHDMALYHKMLCFARQWLDDIVQDYVPGSDSKENWKKTYAMIKTDSWPDCDRIDQYLDLPEKTKKSITNIHRQNPKLDLKTVPRMLIDKNGVEVQLDWSQTFVTSALTVIDQNRMTMKNNSDPVKAHDSCHFRNCHQLNKGKLYKCPLVSVLPDFLAQFDVQMTPQDTVLAHLYHPVSSKDANFVKFVNSINEPIPQCKYCPVEHSTHNFVGTDKKIKITKLPKCTV